MTWEQDTTAGKVTIEWLGGTELDKPVSDKLEKVLQTVQDKGSEDASEDEKG